MIRFELRCGSDHEFDAWFQSNAAYERQAERGEISCPVCGDSDVVKAPMAPSIARSASRARLVEKMHAQAQAMRRHVETHFEYVGPRFAEEARQIHNGQGEKRDIYGEATSSEVRALESEGVPVGRIPWPAREDA